VLGKSFKNNIINMLGIFILIYILFILYSCNIQKEEIMSKKTILGNMPDDFYFIFRGGSYNIKDMMILFDTKNNIIGRLPSYGISGILIDEYISDDYYVSDEDLEKIYNNIIKYEIYKLNNNELWYTHGSVWDDPPSYANLYFHFNSVSYSVSFDFTILLIDDNYHDEQLKNLSLFVKYIREFYHTNEYKVFS